MDLSAAVKRLEGATHPATALQAATALLSLWRGPPSTAQTAALKAVLRHSVPDVVQAGCDKLQEATLAGWMSPAAVQELVFSQLSNSIPPGWGPLAQALVDSLLIVTTAGAAQSAAGQLRWSQHPAVSAWLLQPQCGGALLHSCIQALQQAARQAAPESTSCNGKLTTSQAWAALEPVFAYVLRQAAVDTSQGAAATAVSLRAQLCSLLMRLACTWPGEYGMPVASLLVNSLQCHLLEDATDRSALSQHAPDLADLLQLTSTRQPSSAPPTSATLSDALPVQQQAVQALLSACWEAGFTITVRPLPGGHTRLWDTPVGDASCNMAVLSALARVTQSLSEGLLRHRALDLALITTQQTGKAKELALSLLYSALIDPQFPDAALTLCPMLQDLAYGSTPRARAWAGHILNKLQPVLDGPEAALTARTSASGQGGPDLLLLEQARGVLCAVQQPGQAGHQAAVQWLQALAAGWDQARDRVRQAQRAASANSLLSQTGSNTGAGDPPAQTLHEVPPVVGMVVCAGMVAGHTAVRAAAVQACHALLALSPSTSLTLLPTVLFCLRRERHPEQVSALMSLLSRMLVHPPAAPLVMRALQPMQAASAPLPLRCAALQTVVNSWILTGQGWLAVESALLGYVAPGSPLPPLPLRLTRAALILAVCEKDPEKGLDLVMACQECLEDPSPGVVALGLRALNILCETDLLDWYKAWKVVARLLPKLPSHRLAATAWVAFMAGGHLDARTYPEQATALLQGLWAATCHPTPQVRHAAYRALLSYPLELMEELGTLPPLNHFTTPLIGNPAAALAAPAAGDQPADTPSDPGWEDDATVREAMLQLAVRATQYEHENRRRLFTLAATGGAVAPGQAGVPGDGGGGDVGGGGSGVAEEREERALRYRLTSVLPELLARPFTPAVNRPASNSTSTAALPASAAAALLVMKMAPAGRERPQQGAAWLSDLLVTLGHSGAASLVGGVLTPGWEVGCWRNHWSRHPPPSPSSTLDELSQLCDTGNAAQRCAAPLAVAGLLTSDQGATAAPGVDVPSVINRLLLRAATTLSPGEASALLVAVADLAQCLHATDTHTRGHLLTAFTTHFLSTAALPSSPASGPQAGQAPSAAATGATRVPAMHALSTLAALCLSHTQQDALEAADSQSEALSLCQAACQGTATPPTPAEQQAEGVVGAVLALLAQHTLQQQPSVKPALQALTQVLPRVLQSALLYAVDSSGQQGANGGRRTFGRVAQGASETASGGSPAALALTRLLAAMASSDRCSAAVRQGAQDVLGVLVQDAATVVQSAVCTDTGSGAQGMPQEAGADDEATPWDAGVMLALDILAAGMAGGVTTGGGQQAVGWASVAQTLLQLVDSEAADGGVRGKAALTLACLCCPAQRLRLLQAQSGGSHANTLVGGLSGLVQRLCDMARGGLGLQQGSGCTAGRAGAVLGLAVLLAGPSAPLLLLGGPSAGNDSTAASGGLIAQGQWRLVRVAMKTLEEQYKGSVAKSGPRDRLPGSGDTRAAAALALAAVSRSLQQQTRTDLVYGASGRRGDEEGADDAGDGGQGGHGTGAGVQLLSRYPEQGPLRRCTAALMDLAAQLDSRAGAGGQPTAVLQRLVAALTCLAHAPRLGKAHYGSSVAAVLRWAVHHHRQTTHAQQPASQPESPTEAALATNVCTACVRVLLSHAHEPATGLAPVLAAQLTQVQLAALPHTAAGLLLSHLSRVSASLAASRSAELLQGLPHYIRSLLSMPPEPTPSAPPDASAAYNAAVTLASSMWDGVLGLLNTSNLSPTLQAAVTSMVSALFDAMPTLSCLLPAEAQSMQAACTSRSLTAAQQTAAPWLQETTWQQHHGRHTTSHPDPQGTNGRGHTDGRRHMLQLWVAAARALLQCGGALPLPHTLVGDALLQQSAGSGAASHTAAVRACQMRCLLVLCGGGRARLSESHLAACRAWLHSQDSTVPPGVQAVAVLLGEALAASAAVPRQVQYVCGALSHNTTGAQLLATCLATAALTSCSVSQTAAADAVLRGSITAGGPWAASQGLCGVQPACQGHSLSYLLPRLLSASDLWSQQLESLVRQLLQSCKEASPGSRDAQVACLMALRRWLHAAAVQDRANSRAALSSLLDELLAVLDRALSVSN